MCRADNLPPACADCHEIWEPERSGTPRASTGIALPFYLPYVYGCVFHPFRNLTHVFKYRSYIPTTSQSVRRRCLEQYCVLYCRRWIHTHTVIPRLTSDPANERIFRPTKIFFSVFWTRLTNMDSANEFFSGCAR